MGDFASEATLENLLDYLNLTDKIPLLWFMLKKQVIVADQAMFIDKVFTDKAIQARVQFLSGVTTGTPTLVGRSDVDGSSVANNQNNYHIAVGPNAVTADLLLRKYVATVVTTIATEAVDITAGGKYAVLLNCNGTLISAYRGANSYNNDIQGSSSASATDTSLASGRFGIDGMAKFRFPSASVEGGVQSYYIGAYLKGAI